MRFHHLHVAYLDKATSSSSPPPTFPFAFKCLRPLAPKISLPEPRKMIAPPDFARVRNASKLLNRTVQVATVAGTTRWNPSAEQIKVLEMLYRGGMRTPNAGQIERITEELGKYGRIEGKNVFYWFQNHKARERQKQKRAALLTLSTLDSSAASTLPAGETKQEPEKKEVCDDVMSCKRRCRAWGSEHGGHGDAATEADGVCSTDDATLELFPLHPQREAT